MIPVKLELKNFLAYRDTDPLDFTGLHLACLVGANGAGKSSILEAITWSLWGKARTKTDNELIYLGETEMFVSFTFDLEDNRYRVRRERSSKGRGISSLFIEVLDEDAWRNITEATIKGTQDKINRILRLDYNTFVNSAFLAQGHADEFTTRTPAERKAILGEILDMDIWNTYEERAKQRVKQVDNEINQLEGEIRSIETELEREIDYRRELNEANTYLRELGDHLDEVESQYREMETRRREWERLQLDLENIEKLLDSDQENLNRLQADYDEQLGQQAEFAELLNVADEIEKGFQALQQSRQQESELSDRQAEYNALRDQISHIENTISAARASLEAETRTLDGSREQLQIKIAKSQESEQADALSAEIEELENLEVQVEEWGIEAERLSNEMTRLQTTNGSLREEMNLIKEQIEQIEAVTDPTCPLCGQELSESHKSDLIESLSQQGKDKGDTFRENKRLFDEHDNTHTDLREAIQTARRDSLHKLPALKEHRARLLAQQEQADTLSDDLAQITARIEELQDQLINEGFAMEERVQLAELNQQLDSLGYNQEAYREIREQLEINRAYELRKVELDRAQNAFPEVQSKLERIAGQIETWSNRIEEQNTKQDELSQAINELADQVQGFDELENQLLDLREQEANARHRVGGAEQRIRALEQRRERKDTLLERRTDLAHERGVYEELRRSFGRDGIPAMIIEAAIPEIENEANQILGRMTDGRMHIRFETQKENITGGTRETLDIRIADELGSRDYATFSGGESFRVNFAIRLALSRLLARRAGARLRTLIIDEGFGTQDTEGRERLVHAITAIQEEFDLVLVITHIDELKDAFQARIEVTKTPNGSFIEIA